MDSKDKRKEKLFQITKALEEGDLVVSRSLFDNLRFRRFSRAEKLEAANLARRAGLEMLALRLLGPAVRPRIKTSDASNEEKACYAITLGRIGAVQEALSLINTADENHPEVLLYKSYLATYLWEYDKVAGLLHRYLETPGLSANQRAVAKLNLAGALVYERAPSGLEVVKELIEESHRDGFGRIHGIALHVAAQEAFYREDWSKARSYLDLAAKILRPLACSEEFLVRKWIVFVDLFEKGPGPESLERLAQIRREAIEQKRWESVRQCAFYEAKSKKDQAQLLHVYFGTPHASFRREIEILLDKPIPSSFEFRLWGGKTLPVLDVQEGTWNGKPIDWKSGQLTHRLLITLISDGYKPFPLASLFYALYPEEYFNPDHSPHRLHSVILRVRAFLAEKRIPLEIEESDSIYRLKANGPCAIKVFLQSEPSEYSKNELFLSRLKENLGEREGFLAKEMQNVFRFSKPTTNRVLKDLEVQGKIRRVGAGKNTWYKLVG